MTGRVRATLSCSVMCGVWPGQGAAGWLRGLGWPGRGSQCGVDRGGGRWGLGSLLPCLTFTSPSRINPPTTVDHFVLAGLMVCTGFNPPVFNLWNEYDCCGSYSG